MKALTLLTRAAFLGCAFVALGILPAHSTMFTDPYDRFMQGEIDFDGATPVITCTATAPCPVAAGSCAKRIYEHGGNKYHYCDCDQRTVEDPSNFDKCGIVGKFSGSGTFLDVGCAIAQCAPGCSCGMYPASPPLSGQKSCECE